MYNLQILKPPLQDVWFLALSNNYVHIQLLLSLTNRQVHPLPTACHIAEPLHLQDLCQPICSQAHAIHLRIVQHLLYR